jgi:hypothetical protein
LIRYHTIALLLINFPPASIVWNIKAKKGGKKFLL